MKHRRPSKPFPNNLTKTQLRLLGAGLILGVAALDISFNITFPHLEHHALILADKFGLRQYEFAHAPLNGTHFSPFALLAQERLSPTSSILRLRAPHANVVAAKKTHGVIDELQKQGVWSVEVVQPQLQIVRRYTPLPFFDEGVDARRLPYTITSVRDFARRQNLPPVERMREAEATAYPAEPSDLALLVRREPQGEVSSFLHRARPGSTLGIRGGYLEFRVPEGVSDVVFLAGGTGIAPALQVARCLGLRGEGGRMTVLWASRGREDCVGGGGGGAEGTMIEAKGGGEEKKGVIVRQLDSFRKRKLEGSGQLELRAKYFVDQEHTFLGQGDISEALSHSPSSTTNAASVGRRLILVSGPDGFVDYVAGPKERVNGVETQGRIGGLLSKVDTIGWEVWKF